MSTSAITGRIIYKQDIRANLDANIRSNSLVFDLTNSRLLYSPSGTSYYEFYPGQTSGGGGGSGSVTSVGATSTTLTISNSPITSSGNISVNLSAIGSQGIYEKVSVDSFGRVVSGSALTSADIPVLGYVSISAIQAIANQTLVLVSGVSASTVSATPAGLVSFQYGIIPNMIGIIVSGTSAGSYTATYNIYTTNDGFNLTKIAYGTISNLNYVDSNIILNAYNNSSFVADVSISGSVSNPGISISVKS